MLKNNIILVSINTNRSASSSALWRISFIVWSAETTKYSKTCAMCSSQSIYTLQYTIYTQAQLVSKIPWELQPSYQNSQLEITCRGQTRSLHVFLTYTIIYIHNTFTILSAKHWVFARCINFFFFLRSLHNHHESKMMSIVKLICSTQSSVIIHPSPSSGQFLAHRLLIQI